MSDRGAGVLARAGAIARRDLRTQVSYHFALLLRLGSLGFSIAIFFFISKLVGNAEELAQYRGGYFEFVLIGLAVTSFTLVGLRTFASTIGAEQGQGTLEILLTMPTGLGPILAGALAVPLTMTALEIAVYLGVGVGVFGVGLPPGGVLLSIPLLILTVSTFCALGIFSAAFIVLTKRGDPITAFIAQSTSFLGGALFPVTLFPEALQSVSRVVPAYYGIKGLRDVLIGGAGAVDILDELAVLAAFTAVLLPAAMATLRWALRIAKTTGTLGNY